MAQVKLSVMDITGKYLEEVSVVFNLAQKGLVERFTDKDGSVSISGLDVGSVPVTISKEGYAGQAISVEITKDEQTINKEIVMVATKKEEKKVEDIATEAVSIAKNVVVEKLAPVVVPYIFKQPKTFEEAKKAFKELEENIKNQQSAIEQGIKAGTHNLVQQQASNLVYTMSSQLTEAIHWYVNERSKLNAFGSLKEFTEWAKYSSMIGALFLLRQNLVEYVNKLLTKIEKGL